VGRAWPGDGLERGGEFAAPEGRAVPPVADALVSGALARAEFSGLDRGCADRGLEEAVADAWWPGISGAVAGLNVATDSMAPATRQTARMLASRGITVPCRATGRTSLRSRLRRRLARTSRW